MQTTADCKMQNQKNMSPNVIVFNKSWQKQWEKDLQVNFLSAFLTHCLMAPAHLISLRMAQDG
jgi:hypothetical protein